MSHKSIRLLIEDTAKSLADNIQFIYAKPPDFNVLRDKKYPFINLDTLSATPQYTVNGTTNYMKAWICEMSFYQLDNAASTPEEYALILDEMDTYVDQFVNKLNTYSYDSDKILVQSITQRAFVKVMADFLTGHLLSFTILAHDNFNYCSVACELTDECGNNRNT